MNRHGRWTVLTYRSDDGQHQEQVLNTRDGVVPQVITLKTGQQGALKQSVQMPPQWNPPTGMRRVVNAGASPDRRRGVQLNVCWPGQPVITGG